MDIQGGDSPLGKSSPAVSDYDPGLLFPILRAESREQLRLPDPLPFMGEDLWNGYELSWLDPTGKPRVGGVSIRVPCESPCLVESKSLKLYLNSLYGKSFASAEQVAACISDDLATVTDSQVAVEVQLRGGIAATTSLPGILLDELPLSGVASQPSGELLACVDGAGELVAEELHSHLLRSLCPVTSQPDWGSLYIRYKGSQIDHESLLAYVVSFREHQDFHEHCVERIYCDLMAVCQPLELSVYARYLRRGGLEINPWRSNVDVQAPQWRTERQ
jgi:7-cyano-7-deazaguanine reductase